MPLDNKKYILKRFGATTIVIWTLLIGMLLAIRINDHHNDTINDAVNEARDYFRLNLFYRGWASKMGGVYVAADKVTPNPYLQVPNRDITTSDNRRLTLVNPAYMSRMVFEDILASSPDPIISKITSLKPLNPANNPDEWEQKSLTAFDNRQYTERSEVTDISGKPYLRFISAFTTEASCLKCHAHQGYKVGDVRGAIVISVPLSKHYELQRQTDRKIMSAYGFLWIVGSIGIAFASNRRFSDEETVRQEQTRTQSYLEAIETMVVVLDTNGRITTINRKACQILGYREDELLGRSWFTTCLQQPEGMETLYPHYLKIMAGEFGPTEYHENKVVTKNGELRQVAWHNSLLRNSREEVVGTISAGEDVTERKQAEEETRSLTQRLQLATSSAHLGIWDWNVKENTMVWDDRMFELYGLNRDDFQNCVDAWMNGLHPDDRKAAIAEYQSALNGEREYDTEFRVQHPDGVVKYIKGKGLVIRDDDGNAARMIGISYDITETKQAEGEKNKLESQLQQSQKMESVGRLAGGVAHDFNNMLGVIMGHAELGLMHLDPANQVCADLNEIKTAAERSADLTRQLLAFARKQTVSPKVIDLNDTVTAMLKMLQRLIGEDIHLTWQPSPDLCQIKIDPSQIDQILANLCVNARDAIEDTGRVTIETGNCSIDADYCASNPEATPGEYVRLVVSDDGKGMDRETMTHIFEPFYTTKELGKGTGLGLATIYGAVKQNNGFINIYSEPDKGTTFSIYLPCHKEDGPGTAGRTQAAAVAPRGQETILLVEDEAAILNITAIMLEKQGYTVLRADSPDQAIKLAHEHHGAIQLLMSDVIMPEMNGRDLARHIQSIHPGIKRLFMSGYTADVIAHHGVLDEGVTFIQKPFSLQNMAAKVREVLDKP